jgi:fructose-1,6-bisphosphatase/inositol monophosphatase family enzyme
VNGEAVSVNDKDGVEDAVFGLEASASSPYSVGGVDERLDDNGGNVVRLMSSNYTSMLIASGELAGIVYAGDKPFDGAAVKLVVEEAGGRVTDIYGEEQRYDKSLRGYVASNGLVHDELLDFITR